MNICGSIYETSLPLDGKRFYIQEIYFRDICPPVHTVELKHVHLLRSHRFLKNRGKITDLDVDKNEREK